MSANSIVFAGPSLYGATDQTTSQIRVAPPARGGDLIDAVEAGFEIIGLVDGEFEQSSSVRHKEILYALSQGVAVFGAASMGALRAAECARFGMIGIGDIFEEYASSKRKSDADVALVFGPSELGYPPLTTPLVDIDATLAVLIDQRQLLPHEAERLRVSSARIHFRNRTLDAIAELAARKESVRNKFLYLLKRYYRNQKQRDALQLFQALGRHEAAIQTTSPWKLSHTHFLKNLLSSTEKDNSK